MFADNEEKNESDNDEPFINLLGQDEDDESSELMDMKGNCEAIEQCTEGRYDSHESKGVRTLDRRKTPFSGLRYECTLKMEKNEGKVQGSRADSSYAEQQAERKTVVYAIEICTCHVNIDCSPALCSWIIGQRNEVEYWRVELAHTRSVNKRCMCF